MYLNTWSRVLIGSLAVLAALMILILGFHLLGPAILKVGLYSQLFGALLGGLVAIISVNVPIRFGEEAEPWLGNERVAWTLIGLGSVMWGIGELIYRYLLAHNLPSFPAWSDAGYSALPPLIFLGLLLQPSSGSGRGRFLVMLDSLISMGSILAVAWFLLLGNMAHAPGEANLGKFLGLYYPVSDMALLSCVIFLILRAQGRVYEANARRISLLLVGIGICVFAVSDFNYNIQNNMGTYVDGTWADLGWPLGLMIIAIAAHLRRFVLSPSGTLLEERIRQREERANFGPAQLVPYLLLGLLLLVLVFNVIVFANDPTQAWNRPVLLLSTVGVVALVVVRQLSTQLENERLSRKQSISLERLAAANARVEEQARSIAEHNASLEEGIAHLKEVQAQLANGNLRARARINSGSLISLAGSFNIMADRLLRFDQVDVYAQKLTRALNDLSRAFEAYRTSGHFTLPASCVEFPEISRLLISMGMRQSQAQGTEQAHSHAPQRQALVRPASKPLLGSQAANRAASLSSSNRSISSPLSSPDSRTGASQQRSSQISSGPSRGPVSSGGLGSPASSDLPQLDFPPSTRRGDDRSAY